VPNPAGWSDAEAVLAQAEEAMRRVSEAQAMLATVTGEGASDDALVRAVTDHEGGLKGVTFEPRVMRLDGTEIAKRVTVAVQRAQADAKAKVEELLGDALDLVQPYDETLIEDRLAEVAEELERHTRGA
jgi:DNA-binding protein YbaB